MKIDSYQKTAVIDFDKKSRAATDDVFDISLKLKDTDEKIGNINQASSVPCFTIASLIITCLCC